MISRPKSIALGCDDTASLSAVVSSIGISGDFNCNIVSATSQSDLFSIVSSLKIDLVILHFRNNQHVLNDYEFQVNRKDIPILCITRSPEYETLRWGRNHIVFTCPAEMVRREDHFLPRLHSILLLSAEKQETAPAPPYSFVETHSLAEAARHIHQPQDTRHLSRYVMELDQKAEVLTKVKDRITDLYTNVDDSTRNELISIVNSIKASANNQKFWDDFKLFFEHTNPDFLFLLAQKHPELTSRDLKYCCYLKMNMSNDDIRNLLGINQESVRTHKYRLKKKMNLPRDQDLSHYLRQVDLKELR